MSQVEFALRSRSSEEGPAEYMKEINGEETFHVDLESKEAVWRLPDFQKFVTFQTQGALANMAIDRSNLGILMRRSNYTPAQNGTAGLLQPFRAGASEPPPPAWPLPLCPPPTPRLWLRKGPSIPQGREFLSEILASA